MQRWLLLILMAFHAVLPAGAMAAWNCQTTPLASACAIVELPTSCGCCCDSPSCCCVMDSAPALPPQTPDPLPPSHTDAPRLVLLTSAPVTLMAIGWTDRPVRPVPTFETGHAKPADVSVLALHCVWLT